MIHHAHTIHLSISNFNKRRPFLLCRLPLGVICLTNASIDLSHHEIDVMPRERVYLTCLFNLHSMMRGGYRSERWIDALGAKLSEFY